jgi:UDP-glucose 4-epimerase
MLISRGFAVTIIDTLEHGHRQAVPPEATFVEGNIGDEKLLTRVFSQNHIDAVLHFAGYIFVGESVEKPVMYFENNVFRPLRLLETMRSGGASVLIFSSTAAVYGNHNTALITESSPKKPLSPYGLSKWNFEEILSYYEQRGIRSISLRYFNAAGADLAGLHGEDHDPEGHIIPNTIAAALGTRKDFRLFGTDYDTPDGTCVRDYIHVEDLCDAHIKALEALWDGHKTDAFNVGTGKGVSNKKVIETVKKISNKEFPVIHEKRRAGDAATLVADPAKLMRELGWKPVHSDIETIVSSAWKWHSGHPNGYGV